MLIVKKIFPSKNHLKLFLVSSRLCPKWLKSCNQTCTCTVTFNSLSWVFSLISKASLFPLFEFSGWVEQKQHIVAICFYTTKQIADKATRCYEEVRRPFLTISKSLRTQPETSKVALIAFLLKKKSFSRARRMSKLLIFKMTSDIVSIYRETKAMRSFTSNQKLFTSGKMV